MKAKQKRKTKKLDYFLSLAISQSLPKPHLRLAKDSLKTPRSCA